MTTETQTAVDKPKDEVTPPSAEVAGAQTTETAEADLDSLLKEWETDEEPKGSETGKETTTTEQKVEVSPQLEKVLKYVEGQMAQDEVKTRQQVEKEYKETVTSLKGDLPVSEKVVDGYLRTRASEDPRILSAYQQRHKNPESWKKVEKALQTELRKEIGALPDKAATDARNQITSAIQNAQSTNVAVVEKDTKDMSDAEFYQYQQRMLNG